MLQPLLATKLYIPSARSRPVPRPNLVAKLNASLQEGKRLQLIIAPAGYGKTTLLVEWIDWLKKKGEAGQLSSSHGVPIICWLSLDETDNDPYYFLHYLIEALKPVLHSQQYQACLTLLANVVTSQPGMEQNLLIALLNSLNQSCHPFVLILDDYHVITHPAIHQILQYLLTNEPPLMRIMIATRSDPPLGLAKLRARDQLCEIRMTDLTFSVEEAEAFFQRSVALHLTREEVEILEARTEGWVAGLQMAALLMSGKVGVSVEVRHRFLQTFSGSHRFVMEYLLEEVFNQQPPEIQSFLLCSSILERMCAPLCQAVLETPDCQATLDYLERSNLFLVALDDSANPPAAAHCWYRYHHLFAGLLRNRLRQSADAAAIQVLYQRASKWYEEQGMVVEAITQAMAAAQWDFTAALLERHIMTFFYQSEITQVHRWLQALPETIIIEHPLLCAVYAAATALMPPYPPETLAGAERWMQAAERKLNEEEPLKGTKGCLARAFALKIRSYWARFQGEAPEMLIRLTQDAFAVLPDDIQLGEMLERERKYFLCIRSALHTNLGFAYWASGDEWAARHAFCLAQAVAVRGGDVFNEATAINCLIRIDTYHGQLHSAAALCRQALSHFEDLLARLGHRAPFTGEIGVRYGEILVEQNRLDEAEPILMENIELAKWTMSHNILIEGQLSLARLEQARGNAEAAICFLHEVEQISDLGAGLASAQRTHLWLAARKENPAFLDLARQWAEGQALVEFDSTPPQMEWEISLALAHLMLAEHSLQAGQDTSSLAYLLEWLERQESRMTQGGWVHWMIQLGLLEALARQVVGDAEGALAILLRVTHLAEPGGYVRVFVEEGEPMHGLLSALKHQANISSPYLNTLLAAFHPTPKQPDHAPIANQSLVEPLTARELEILHLICQGLSNQQIAEKLVVSLNTVKKHNYSIFQKLDVTNRSQAILMVRKLGLDKDG